MRAARTPQRAPVGVTEMHLTDRTRPDPWVPESGAREVGVTLYYPAAYPTNAHAERVPGRPATYLDAQESRALLEGLAAQNPGLEELPDDILTTVRTGAVQGAPVRRGRHALVLLSPGFGFPAATLTGTATELASRGYVVAAMDHPYESFGTTLADGTLAPCAACATDDYAKVPRVRAAGLRPRAGPAPLIAPQTPGATSHIVATRPTA